MEWCVCGLRTGSARRGAVRHLRIPRDPSLFTPTKEGKETQSSRKTAKLSLPLVLNKHSMKCAVRCMEPLSASRWSHFWHDMCHVTRVWC